jgi:hypothetical protein
MPDPQPLYLTDALVHFRAAFRRESEAVVARLHETAATKR